MKMGMLTGLWFVSGGTSALDTLRRVAALGFKHVDLHGTFHAGPEDLSRSERSRIRDELERLELELRSYVLHSPKNIASQTISERRECLGYLSEGIDLAAFWGANHLMLNAGQWVYGMPREQTWKTSVFFLQGVCDYAADQGVIIALEAEPYVCYIMNDLRSSIRMMDAIDRPNIGLLVDLGHMALAREGPKDLDPIADSVIHVHASDHEPLRHTNQILGTGFAQLGEYLHALRDLAMDERVKRFGLDELAITFELGFPGQRIANPEAWAAQSIAHIKEVAPYVTF